MPFKLFAVSRSNACFLSYVANHPMRSDLGLQLKVSNFFVLLVILYVKHRSQMTKTAMKDPSFYQNIAMVARHYQAAASRGTYGFSLTSSDAIAVHWGVGRPRLNGHALLVWLLPAPGFSELIRSIFLSPTMKQWQTKVGHFSDASKKSKSRMHHCKLHRSDCHPVTLDLHRFPLDFPRPIRRDMDAEAVTINS